MDWCSVDGNSLALSETGDLHFSAQCVCHLLNESIVQEGTVQYRCATISRLQMEHLFGKERRVRYHRWLPGAASQFHSLVETFLHR